MIIALGTLSLLIWIYLLVFHHRFWRADQQLEAPDNLSTWPSVTAIVPARNEAATIDVCVESLVAQDYPGPFSIIVVDDHSTDNTSAIARQAGDAFESLQVLNAPALQEGWSGKLWALKAGLDHDGAETDFIWFTDADIAHAPDTLRTLVSKAQTDARDLVSLMVKLHCRSFWEKLLVPAFVYFFQMLYPFPAVNDPNSPTAGAAGGCILVRRTILDRIGGLAAIKDQIIDDCALAAAVQRAGGRLWLGLTETSHSLRAASGLGDLWHMVTRTAFTQLRYSPILLAGTILGLIIMFIVPPVFILTGWFGEEPMVFHLGLWSWILMAATYSPTLLLYQPYPLMGPLLPFVGLLYGAMTMHSAINHWMGQSSRWKDRLYENR